VPLKNATVRYIDSRITSDTLLIPRIPE